MCTGLLDVLNAGCTDLMECSCQPGCPIPFPGLHTELDTDSTRHGKP